MVYDSEVTPVKYLSFASSENTEIEYYYNCTGEGNIHRLGNMMVYKSIQNLFSPTKLGEVLTKSRESTYQKMREMMRVGDISTLNLMISVLNLFIFSILIISLYCVYITTGVETDV